MQCIYLLVVTQRAYKKQDGTEKQQSIKYIASNNGLLYFQANTQVLKLGHLEKNLSSLTNVAIQSHVLLIPGVQ